MKKIFKLKYAKNKELQISLNINRIIKKSIVPQIINKNYDKVFCIGFNKTGTTSIEKVLKDFNFKIGNQRIAEILAEDWANKRTDRIIKYCHTADAFQDIPFSLPHLYKELDKSFPQSKFILTVRDSENQWLNSVVKFQSKMFSSDKSKAPTQNDLQEALYGYKGWAFDIKYLFWDYPKIPLYYEVSYKQKYLDHIADVKEYFKDRPNDILVLNVADHDSYQKLANFLNVKVAKDAKFPWLNKT